jgi:hypothetical protein
MTSQALSENVNCAEVTVDEVVHLDHRLLTKVLAISLTLGLSPLRMTRWTGRSDFPERKNAGQASALRWCSPSSPIHSR